MVWIEADRSVRVWVILFFQDVSLENGHCYPSNAGLKQSKQQKPLGHHSLFTSKSVFTVFTSSGKVIAEQIMRLLCIWLSSYQKKPKSHPFWGAGLKYLLKCNQCLSADCLLNIQSKILNVTSQLNYKWHTNNEGDLKALWITFL